MNAPTALFRVPAGARQPRRRDGSTGRRIQGVVVGAAVAVADAPAGDRAAGQNGHRSERPAVVRRVASLGAGDGGEQVGEAGSRLSHAARASVGGATAVLVSPEAGEGRRGAREPLRPGCRVTTRPQPGSGAGKMSQHRVFTTASRGTSAAGIMAAGSWRRFWLIRATPPRSRR